MRTTAAIKNPSKPPSRISFMFTPSRVLKSAAERNLKPQM